MELSEINIGEIVNFRTAGVQSVAGIEADSDRKIFSEFCIIYPITLKLPNYFDDGQRLHVHTGNNILSPLHMKKLILTPKKNLDYED